MGVRMFTEQNIDLINQAVENEYKQICSTYGTKYNSEHEGYAVLKEEVEEVSDELEYINNFMRILWLNVKTNDKLNGSLNGIKERAKFLAQEAFQVAAVCQRFLNTLQGENKEND